MTDAPTLRDRLEAERQLLALLNDGTRFDLAIIAEIGHAEVSAIHHDGTIINGVGCDWASAWRNRATKRTTANPYRASRGG